MTKELLFIQHENAHFMLKWPILSKSNNHIFSNLGHYIWNPHVYSIFSFMLMEWVCSEND